MSGYRHGQRGQWPLNAVIVKACKNPQLTKKSAKTKRQKHKDRQTDGEIDRQTLKEKYV